MLDGVEWKRKLAVVLPRLDSHAAALARYEVPTGVNRGSMAVMEVPTAFGSDLRPTPQEGIHARYCEPKQKSMAGEVIGSRGNPPLSFGKWA